MEINSFIGVNMTEITSGTGTNVDTGTAVYSLMFSEQITLRIREAVALVVLKMEKVGFVIVNNQTIYINGKTGIFNTKDEIKTGVDAIDWCSSPYLSQCPNQSTCSDSGIRYNCICNKGYFKNDTFCQPTIQLVNSSLANEGLLEYYSDGAWNTVCKQGFESREAGVVCRQTGYPSRGAQFFSNNTYISMTSSIWSNDLNCSGKERVLSDCAVGERFVNCTHLDDISVVCDAECPDNYHYGPNCTQLCSCPQNNTESCDRQNGTCYCNEGWEGVTCEKDVDECALKTGICTGVKEVCQNTPGGYDCVCASYAKRNATGTCVGVVDVSGPSLFRTDGSRSLTLTCSPGNVTENVNITWSVLCDASNNRTCTFTPKPPGDDGKIVTCTVTYSDGQSSSKSFTLYLNYPPSLPPAIQGYNNGEELHVGSSLIMTCTVQGGKPLAKAVVFSCPNHPDRQQDVINSNQVQSILTFDPLHSSDNDIFCVCIAEWEDTDWYTQSATRRLIVNGTEADTSVPIALIAGLTGGVGAGLVTVIVVVILIRRHQRNKMYDLTNHGLAGVVSPYTNAYTYDDTDPYSEIKDMTDAYSEGNLHNYIEILTEECPQTNSNPWTDDPRPCHPAFHTFITDSAKDRDLYLHPNYSSPDKKGKVGEVDGYLHPIHGPSVEPGTGENQEGMKIYLENDPNNPETQRSDYLLAVNIHISSKEETISTNSAISLVTDKALEATDDVLDDGVDMMFDIDDEEQGDPRTDYLLPGDDSAVDGDVDSFGIRLESSTHSKDDYLHPAKAQQDDQMTCPNETVEGNLKHDYFTPSSSQSKNEKNYTIGYSCASPTNSKKSSQKDYLHPDGTGIFHATNKENESSCPLDKGK